MMIDIFQFSNMYTLCRSISWLADEAHVRDECGPYVTKPGQFMLLLFIVFMVYLGSNISSRSRHIRVARPPASIFATQTRIDCV